ncbi:hypothetical protein FDP41_003991 [Naegleria fowleri]|uniref:NAD-dependent epimerase/dehydratase domain-containing protein n=1 Tax=Naegleria fowleri TaxID=5763 RepID=A0A6A5BNY2_NAEFO|nr:uncharacterized protein FDP41_003991 [Naegleria fowleri]KAF0976696.1 hypothetical protein FDP41_003991 [Naegleria fowleri]CAG4713342.1 unnamed protein product [Naegleria fowleri]
MNIIKSTSHAFSSSSSSSSSLRKASSSSLQQISSIKTNIITKRFGRQKVDTFRQAAGINPHTNYPVATVFGCTGFVGRYIVAALADAGYQVITPFRRSEFEVMNHRVMGDVGQVVAMRFDLKRYDSILDICARSNVVVNCIGRDHKRIFDNVTMYNSNVESAEIISKACKETNVDRFIQMSFLNADKNSESEYWKQKALAEEAAKSNFEQTTIIRSANAYGTEDSFLNLIAKQIRIFPMVPLTQKGLAKVQPVFVGDVAHGVARAVLNSRTIGKIVELAGPRQYTYSELVDIIAKIIDEEPGGKLMIPEFIGSIVGKINEYTWTPGWTSDLPIRMSFDQVLPKEKGENVMRFEDLGMTPVFLHDAALEPLMRWRRKADYFMDVNYKKL